MDVTAPEPAIYETAYVTSHKGACRSGAFSADGTLVATGSVDASIKVLDVDRMLAKSGKDSARQQQQNPDHQPNDPGHPVIRHAHQSHSLFLWDKFKFLPISNAILGPFT